MTGEGITILLARAITSGTPVDWVEAEASVDDESVRATIRELKLIAEIAELHGCLPPLLRDSPTTELFGTRLKDLLTTQATSDLEAAAELKETWGSLELRERVGEGSFGEVYRAWDTRLDREIALKLLHQPGSAPERIESMVIEEGRMLARVRHPNVVTIYGADRLDGRVGLWMEFVRGRTLEQVVREQGPLGAREAILIGLDVSRALSAVHQAGLLHRDVKAHNVMREDGGRIVLMDFGTGLDLTEDSSQTHPAGGTPLYLAPEVFEGSRPTSRADLYSLGVLLFYLVSGAYPVGGKTLDEVREAHRVGRRRRLRDVRPVLPDKFVQVVEQVLSPDPNTRHESAGAMELALAASLSLTNDGAVSADASSVVTIKAAEATVPRIPATRRVTRRLRGAIPAAAAAGVLAIVIVIGFGPIRDRWRIGTGGAARSGSTGVLAGLVSREVRIDWNKIDPSSGAPSPDGRYLSGVDWTTGDLAILELETGGTRRITNTLKGSDEYNAFSSAPSPNGDRIAYAWANEGDFVDLRITEVNGSKPRVLYRDRAVDHIQIGNWSADGGRILALLTRKDRRTQLAMISVADGAVQVLRSFSGRSPRWISLSPDGRYILYDLPVGDARNHEIFLRRADGDLDFALVEHPANDLYPIWTPEGNRVMFVSDRAGTMGLWMIPVHGGVPTGPAEVIQKDLGQLYPLGLTAQGTLYYALQTGMVDVFTATLDVAAGVVVRQPAPVTPRLLGSNISADWSPDGRYLAFASDRSHLPRATAVRLLVVQDVDTGEVRELAPDLGFFIAPRWSPDQRSILVKGSDSKRIWGAHQVEAQTGHVVGTTLVGTFGSYEWLRVGETLVYVRDRSVLRYELQTDRKHEIHQVSPHSRITDLAVAKDGNRLALSLYNDDETWSIVVVSVDQDDSREIIRMKKPEFLDVQAWTNDEVLFARGRLPADLAHDRELWAIPAQGGVPRSLGLTMKGLRELRFHPDGRRIALTSGAPSWDIRALEGFLPPSR